uniref:Centrosomin N-terminal motif 1 domain-containing protein n=1 Tax=Amazona collaria TaxID=241587 RepID=A0A8B9FJ77_9PSIT
MPPPHGAAMANGYRTLSQHLNDLKKENFSLKLRIYFLEERVQQKGEESRDDVYRRNIELKVEVESLKRELQEKQQALDNTWVAAENQTTRSQAALQQQYEEQQRESEHVYELLENKIQLLQEVSPGIVRAGGRPGPMPVGSLYCHAGGQTGTE